MVEDSPDSVRDMSPKTESLTQFSQNSALVLPGGSGRPMSPQEQFHHGTNPFATASQASADIGQLSSYQPLARPSPVASAQYKKRVHASHEEETDADGEYFSTMTGDIGMSLAQTSDLSAAASPFPALKQPGAKKKRQTGWQQKTESLQSCTKAFTTQTSIPSDKSRSRNSCSMGDPGAAAQPATTGNTVNGRLCMCYKSLIGPA